ncbi:Dehydrogenase reductase SDR member 13 [Balamuthia mandrillaris]
MERNGGEVRDRTFLITGGNAGIGFHTALDLARRNAHVILACRSPQRGAEAVERIKNEVGETANIESMILDLDSLRSIQDFAAEFEERNIALHCLILNAGVMPVFPTSRTETKDGFERCFGVNYLGHFLLTLLLMPSLKRAAPSRVVVVSSCTHLLCWSFGLDDLNLEKHYSNDKAYKHSKFALILFCYEFNRRFAHLGITANALCPGIVPTDIVRDIYFQTITKLAMRLIGCSPTQAAETVVHVAIAEQLQGIGGKYFEYKKERESHPRTYNEELASGLWDASLKALHSVLHQHSTTKLFEGALKEAKVKQATPYKKGFAADLLCVAKHFPRIYGIVVVAVVLVLILLVAAFLCYKLM